jgi:DNA replication protein DnaC
LIQDSAWFAKHENIFVLGPTGVGKSFVASALALANGSLRSLLARLSRIDVRVIDDWAMAPLTQSQGRDFREICEDRYQTRSTILTSQLPVSRWHKQIGDPALANAVLDRPVHNARRIEMCGKSMRNTRSKPERSSRSGVTS